MGEIADMMLDGTLDAYTGEYIGRAVGYPRTLDGSLPWEKRNIDDLRALNGVCKWLSNQGLKNKEDAHHVIRVYCSVMDHQLPKRRSIIKGCLFIQQDFGKFSKWYKTEFKQ